MAEGGVETTKGLGQRIKGKKKTHVWLAGLAGGQKTCGMVGGGGVKTRKTPIFTRPVNGELLGKEEGVNPIRRRLGTFLTREVN